MRLLLAISLFCSWLPVAAQNVLEVKLTQAQLGKPLREVLVQIENENAARFFCHDEWIAGLTVGQEVVGKSLTEALSLLFQGTDLSYVQMYPNTIVIIKDPSQAVLRQNAIENLVRQQKKVESAKIGSPGSSKLQRVVLKGKIIDEKTGKPLANVNIKVLDNDAGTITNESGQYSLTLAPGPYVIHFSIVDFEDRFVDLGLFDSGVLDLEMGEAPTMLDEVVIEYQAAKEFTTTHIGQTQIAMTNIKRAPSFLGESDLIKQVQNLPGVTTVSEAAMGFNVRGGSVDQNLILYDGLPVFNSSHVFGFFSAFNPEAIRSVSFYHGGIPAEYGGRVSSVLDIRSRDGNFERWNGSAGIGMITSNIMVNGPIKKEKTALAASFRSTYSDWLVHSIKTNYADLSNSSVFFYDGALKLTHLISNRTKLSVTSYASKDAFRLVGDTTFQWNNLQLSGRLNHQFSSQLNAEFLAGVSKYGYKVLNDDYLTASELSFQITTTTLKAGFNYLLDRHKVNFGWQLSHYVFKPGALSPTSSESNARDITLDKQYSIENSFYIADDYALTEKFNVEAGLRIPIFMSLGPASVYTYKSGLPREVQNITDTLHYGTAEPIKTYVGLEPRLSVRYTLSATASLKFGYNRMFQNLHLVTNSTSVTPVDIWQPSGYYFKPQRADQISLGIFKDARERKYTLSVEGFYKNIINVIDFKDGAQLVLNSHLETDLLQGKGRAYGIETFIGKNTGRLTGSLNYTYSRAFRTVQGPTNSESINKGAEYRANFDQPHIVNFAWKYDLTKRIFFTGNFTYHTGRPITIPLSAFTFENSTITHFSGRNQYRIADYHRLDIALVVESNHKRNKSFRGSWTFSVYNVYARKNPYSIFFKPAKNGTPLPYQLSIIGTVVPSISYNLKFR